MIMDVISVNMSRNNKFVISLLVLKQFVFQSHESAIGHVRYATAGGSEVANVQPLLFRFSDHSMALAHNGNLINAKMLRRELEAEGSIFQTSSDTEVLLHLIKRSTKDSLIESVKEALNKVKGAFAYLLLTGNEMIVALDPNGFRPLSIGKMGMLTL